MRAILQGFLLFVLWASIGRWYYVCKIKSHCAPAKEEARRYEPPKTLGIYYQDTVLHKGHEQFVYGQSSIQAAFNSNNKDFLNQLILQLRQHQDLEVELTGFYLESEKDNRSNFHSNLGLARAASIQDWLMAKGVAEKRINIRAELTEGQRLIEPLQFHLVSNATAGN